MTDDSIKIYRVWNDYTEGEEEANQIAAFAQEDTVYSLKKELLEAEKAITGLEAKLLEFGYVNGGFER